MRAGKFLGIVAAMGFLAGLVAGRPASADEIEDMVKLVIAGASDDAERSARLVDAAGKLTARAAVRKAQYLKAYEYGLKAPAGYGSAAKALAELEGLEGVSREDLLDKKLALLRLGYARGRGAARIAAAESLMEALTGAGDAKLESGKALEASGLYREASRIAAVLRRSDLVAKLTGKIRECSTSVMPVDCR